LDKAPLHKRKNKLINRLTYKYRLKILNESTFEEVASLRLSQMNIFVFLGALSILLVFLTSYIIAFTPLREYIPGYSDVKTKKLAIELMARADSLEEQMLYKDYYIDNIKNVINGKPTMSSFKAFKDSTVNYRRINDSKSAEDLKLRKEVEEAEKYSITRGNSAKDRFGLFFPPVSGVIVTPYNSNTKSGIEISTKENETIKAVADGNVVYTSWSPEWNYGMVIQHPNNFISIYKKLNSLLKKSGSNVKAGEAISISLENSGKKNTIQFELWYNGSPVNPTNYITI
jgi:septal ring factor EnvC (AmiA/AmiB activator)